MVETVVSDGEVVAFTTERLRARRLTGDDLEFLRALHVDERVMATLGGVRSDEETDRFMTSNLDHWDEHRFGLWILAERPRPDVPVGRGGLRWLPLDDDERIVEVNYALTPALWGRGLASEVAAALVDIALDSYGLDEVGAITLTWNRASERVMQKCGFTYDRTIDTDWGPHVLYRLRREDRPA